MLNLQNKWPAGLRKKDWPISAGIVFVAMIGLLLVDAPVTQWVRGLPEGATAPFHVITRLGNSDWILIPGLTLALAGAILALVPQPQIYRDRLRHISAVAGFYFVAVGGSGLVAVVIKRAVGRARPVHFEQLGTLHFQPNLSRWDFQSFPSGDTTTIFAFAIVTALLWPRLTWPALVLAAAVGLSRIMVGMHYPSDVLGGMLVGTITAIAVRNLYAARGWLFTPADPPFIAQKRWPAR